MGGRKVVFWLYLNKASSEKGASNLKVSEKLRAISLL